MKKKSRKENLHIVWYYDTGKTSSVVLTSKKISLILLLISLIVVYLMYATFYIIYSYNENQKCKSYVKNLKAYIAESDLQNVESFSIDTSTPKQESTESSTHNKTSLSSTIANPTTSDLSLKTTPPPTSTQQAEQTPTKIALKAKTTLSLKSHNHYILNVSLISEKKQQFDGTVCLELQPANIWWPELGNPQCEKGLKTKFSRTKPIQAVIKTQAPLTFPQNLNIYLKSGDFQVILQEKIEKVLAHQETEKNSLPAREDNETNSSQSRSTSTPSTP